MKRLDLIEIEDLEQTPAFIRDAITRLLFLFHTVFRTQDLFAPHLRRLSELTGSRRVIDLCSGGGGAIPLIISELNRTAGPSLEAVLTDLYPNLEAARRLEETYPFLRYRRDPVNAADIPADLEGIRTMVASFHHLPPAVARAVLKDSFDKRQPVALFEITCNRWLWAAVWGLLSPAGIYALTPFYNPDWRQLAATYLVPLIPAAGVYDGVVSHLRTYSEEELADMTADLKAPGYRWEIGSNRHPLIPESWPYLLGIPG